jgi:hypothetical protein
MSAKGEKILRPRDLSRTQKDAIKMTVEEGVSKFFIQKQRILDVREKILESSKKLSEWTTNLSIASLAFTINTIIQIDLRRGIGDEKDILKSIFFEILTAVLIGLLAKIVYALREDFFGKSYFQETREEASRRFLKKGLVKIYAQALSNDDSETQKELDALSDELFGRVKNKRQSIPSLVVQVLTSGYLSTLLLASQMMYLLRALFLTGLYLLAFDLDHIVLTESSLSGVNLVNRLISYVILIVAVFFESVIFLFLNEQEGSIEEDGVLEQVAPIGEEK